MKKLKNSKIFFFLSVKIYTSFINIGCQTDVKHREREEKGEGERGERIKYFLI